jgi:spermidine/putrescine transport system substrate-binding protein
MTTFHPREPRAFARREFLQRTALGAFGLTIGPTLLAACGSGGDGGGGGSSASGNTIPLARPENPVTLPIFDDNPRIDSGLDPEQGPLKIYNYIDYLWKKKLNQFGKEFGVDVQLTTFNTMDEAIAKLSSGATDYDVFFPTPDRMSRLAYGKLLQPINLSYIPNLKANIWPALQDPFYDVGSRYSVPYTTYTTGIGYRTDHVKTPPGQLSNPYDAFWDTSLKGKIFLLDDSREAISMVLLKNGITNLNTEDPKQIEAAKKELLDLNKKVNVKLSAEDYVKLPEGQAWIHQAWSGSMIAGQYYLPKGTDVSVLGYWYPPNGGGAIGSDTIAVLRSAKNPVLAHHFLNFMLDEKNAYENFAEFNGYQPPLKALNPARLVTDEIVAPNLKSAVVEESDFKRGYQELELSPDGQVLWQNAWAEFKAGV